jgi:hypothetical protein
VAKNLKLADALGMSTRLLNHKGLPLSVVSAIARASLFSSISSAILFRTRKRSSAGVTDQDGKAVWAA